MEDGVKEIVCCSWGILCIVNVLLCCIWDFVQIKGNGIIDCKIVEYGLFVFNVDEGGLDEMDNKIFFIIIYKFKGGLVGIIIIGIVVGEEAGIIEEVYEFFLIMEGYIQCMFWGREVIEKVYKYLGVVLFGCVGILFDEQRG